MMVDRQRIRELPELLRGQLVRPDDEGYDRVRKVFNGMIDKRPALVVRCAGVADVVTTVNFAREANLLVAIRGGGHGVTGNAVCDGGLVIDLSTMKSVRVHPENQTARSEGEQPGPTLMMRRRRLALPPLGALYPRPESPDSPWAAVSAISIGR
jgi:hypothetical protein